MKVGFFIVVCVLLAGCGLFNRTKKIDQQAERMELMKESAVRELLRSKRVDQSTEGLRAFSFNHGQWMVYPREGADLIVRPDGSLSVQADSMLGSHSQYLGFSQLRDLNSVENLLIQRDSISSADSLSLIESYQKSVVSRPAFWGVLANGLVFFALLGLLGFVFFKYVKPLLF